jgi:peptidoglycan/LPS O-acetylase OafA/YrhL
MAKCSIVVRRCAVVLLPQFRSPSAFTMRQKNAATTLDISPVRFCFSTPFFHGKERGNRALRDDRLTGLDLLRALACLLVFLHHTTQRLDPRALEGGWAVYYRFFNMGAFGVGVFFLLSGFLLTRPFWVAFDAGKPMPSLRTYVMRRAARIVPGYYVALTVSFILAAAVFGTVIDPEIVRRYLSGLFFVSAFHWSTLFPVEWDGPLWSIGMEVVSYALLPLGVITVFAFREWLAGWKGRLTFVAVVALALLAHWLTVTFVPKETVDVGFDHGSIGGAKYWMPEYNVFGFFTVFALGGLTAGLSVLWRGRSVLADIAALAGLGLAAWAMWMSGADPTRPEAFGWLGIPYDFPVFHLGVALALLALPHSRLLPAITELSPIRYLAKVSFGIYVWHFLLLELLRQGLARDYGYAGVADTGRWMELTAASFVLAVAAGTISWYGVEAPALKWMRRHEGQVAGNQGLQPVRLDTESRPARGKGVAPQAAAPPPNLHA